MVSHVDSASLLAFSSQSEQWPRTLVSATSVTVMERMLNVERGAEVSSAISCSSRRKMGMGLPATSVVAILARSKISVAFSWLWPLRDVNILVRDGRLLSCKGILNLQT